MIQKVSSNYRGIHRKVVRAATEMNFALAILKYSLMHFWINIFKTATALNT